MPTVSQAELANLIKIFRDAREKLMNAIIKGGVGTKVYANTILRQLEKQLRQMEKQSAFYVKSVVPEDYKKALDELYTYFQKNKLEMRPPQSFAALHNDAIYEIAREMQYQIGQGLEQVGRQIRRYVELSRDNTLRQAGLEASGRKAASGGTVQDMRKDLIKQLETDGFMTVTYGEGSKSFQVPVDVYASMVARSTTREAGNTAREKQLTANGYDLVQMTSHYPTCAVCATFQGRVYSISGKDERFPSLFETAFKSGYHNIHPNCRHVIGPWIEGAYSLTKVAEMIKRSNEPFEDKRDIDERELYKKQQAENRRMRQDLYQWERYKQVLGDDAPKTFAAFRRMKKANGDKWGLTQLDYKRRSKLVNNPTLALPNVDTAIADDSKFTRYLFGGDNKDGLSKGVAFYSHLGYNIDNWEDMQTEITNKATLNPANYDRVTQHGTYYKLPMVLYGTKNNPMDVLTAWEIGDKGTRLITIFPNNKKE